MHLFYTPDIEGPEYTLNPEESRHCVKVLRLAEGDSLSLIDGRGNWYKAEIVRPDARGCQVRVLEKTAGYGKRPFHLHVAVAPTKNMDRMEWMLEKCTEMGIDEITPLDTEHSERRQIKEERLEKILVSAMKQSLKAYLPKLNPMTGFREFVDNCTERHRLIAHCRPGSKKSLKEAYVPGEDVVILIGPEGDFSDEEVRLSEEKGFQAVTLGTSRLRTETAGIVACHSINFMNDI